MIHLTEQDIARLLPMPLVVDAVREAFTASGVVSMPRVRLRAATAPDASDGTDLTLNVLAAVLPGGWAGTKSYAARDIGRGHTVVLHTPYQDEPVALVEATLLGALRTGAMSGVATEAMHPEVDVLACVGAGVQAEMQVRGVAAVAVPRQVRIVSRTRARSEELAHRLRGYGFGAVDVFDDVADAVRGADVVCTATRATEPVLRGEWLAPGTHVNAAGSNGLDRREVDEGLVRRADIVVDSRAQARLECGDLVPAVDSGLLRWDALVELGDVLGGRRWRGTADLTLFESQGIGALDVAVAAAAVQAAWKEGNT
ncbi:ornithine cyclodeaminase family protein [Micromonospora sp. NPDC048830]|uniref:ornithine cyclodeaminase family protein n=1 Tax=Micromonospora sp. NPDC048830 TaxID=3364257 RepID=UPI0037238C5C